MGNLNQIIPSRFNAISPTEDQGVILYNSFTGAITYFSEAEKHEVFSILKGVTTDNEFSSSTLQTLQELGFIVSEKVDEQARAQFLHHSLHRTDHMHLVILPTEACNFRCEYCFENFPRGKMTDHAIEGLKKFIEDKATSLSELSISWFGGEPLLEPEIIGKLSQSFLTTAKKYNINYSADLITNGYFLTEDLFRSLLSWKIQQFMITIDGPDSIHDLRRPLIGGGGTFSKIVENLKRIKDINGDFEITIRVNFDENNLEAIPELISFLSEHFSDDSRFQTFFHPVGRWGGKNDAELPICNRVTADKKIYDFSNTSIQQGLKISSLVEGSMMPTGSVCYAAKPHSLVVGSDGKLYKCTTALDEEVNRVGQLHADGSTELDYDKLAFWVTSGEEKDSVCQSCFYRPACQGNHCPLYRMRTGERPCPYEKRKIKNILQLIWNNHSTLKEVKL